MAAFLRMLRGVLPALLLAATATAQPADDPARAGRFDNGKMWLFENPPVEYLAEAYNFSPGDDWFEKARLSALRLPNCSASFVSPHGLVATNHHCARGSVTAVARDGENLLDDGFFAPSLDAERRVPDLYIDQLVAIEDVTAEVDAAVAGAQTDAEHAEARRAARDAAEERLGAEWGDGYAVETVSLYNGGRYSAYVFRRYDDVRVVAVPELQMGYYGGDADNFTYPRFALDFAFLRVYDADGQPLDSQPHFFQWSEDGVDEGDLVFVIGNPGSTNRLETVAQLEWRRDVQIPAMLQFVDSRVAALRAYLDEFPQDDGARNLVFSLLNAQKAYLGREDALADPMILARRRDAERRFRQAVEADAALRAEYGPLFDRMAEIQDEKQALGADFGAFNLMTNSTFSSATWRRALRAAEWYRQRQASASADVLEEIQQEILAIDEQPPGLDRAFLTAQLQTFARFFIGTPLLRDLLQGRSPEQAADAIYAGTDLKSLARAAKGLEDGTLGPADPALALALAIGPRYAAFRSASAGLSEQEEAVGSRLGRARFDVFGTEVPPDATFSLRFTDGVVKGYAYNGTVAPPYTTYFGLYDHYHSYGPDSEWDLPERWLNPPETFDLTTPVNFVSTSDTIGGNSGSPAVNRDLEIVGLNFDRTIEGLSRDYIYLPDRGRNVMVDARAIVEALDEIYDLDRVVIELRTGQLMPTEEDADASARQ